MCEQRTEPSQNLSLLIDRLPPDSLARSLVDAVSKLPEAEWPEALQTSMSQRLATAIESVSEESNEDLYNEN